MASGSCVSADFSRVFKKTQEPQSTAAHVVVCAFPAHGHIIPTFNLSKLLVSKGCIVTYVCTQQRMAELKRRVNLATTENYSNIRLVALPDHDKIPLEKYGIDEGEKKMGWLLDNVSNMQDDFQLLMEEYMTASTSELNSPVCIISDFCLPWTQDVANQFNIPRYVFFPTPAAALCIFMYLPVLISQGVLPVKTHHHQSSGQASTTSIMIPGLPPFSGQHITSSLRDTCPKFWQEYIFRSSCKAHESAGILINTYCGLEKNAIDALQSEAVNPEKVPIYLVGPLLPSEFFHEDGLQSMRALPTHSEEERICVEWLDKRPASSVLYVSFGSITILSEAQIHELAFGLEASGQHFLWVLHPESSLSDASAINIRLPQGFQSRTSKHGLILCRWAPQLLILSHPSVGGFLTHCGWNSTLESVCGGIPMLAFPQFAEQHLNCHFVVEQLRLGVEIRRGASGMAERVEIERSVRVLMNSEEGVLLRKRAREAREGARQALAMAPTYFQMFVQSFLRAI